MPPKKRRGGAAGGAGGKKAKAAAAEPAQPSTFKEAAEALKKADQTKVKKKAKPDQLCPYATTAQVHEDYDCMLNQTNIGNNNNKYYIIQVLQQFGSYYAWNRWGRVGEPGQNAMKGPFSAADKAIADFKKKFKDKTKNDWDNRDNFVPKAGKYTLLEMDQDETEEDAAETEQKLAALDAGDSETKQTVKDCSLDKPTQSLVKLIFDNDMFKDAMKSFDIDVKKMPLGKLSKTQIAKGFEVLEEIENAVNKSQRSKLAELSSRFFTLIPHNFGRQRPPVIGDLETVRKKMDMLLVLGDIELAQAMQKDKGKPSASAGGELPNPLDVNYNLLKCGLEHVGPKEEEYKIMEKYLQNTNGWFNLKILDMWKVDRNDEETRYKAHDGIKNRKMLWHGTNVAVVAAILQSGLRIMPHSGGRVGRGIYFASENSKSACYVGRASGNIGIMFITEVALGKEHHIGVGDSSLKAAPKGYDSIIAKGQTEPDPKQEITMKVHGRDVTVPQGKPVNQSKWSGSHFSQSEYLIYKESQCRIRYLLKLKF